jgi:MFS family permease
MSDTVYGTDDAPPPAKTFTPALIRLSAVVILGVMMTILDTTIVNVAIRTLGRDFHTSVATIQWVATGYLLALALVSRSVAGPSSASACAACGSAR